MDNEIIDNLKPKTFHIIRQADESGVSGTGKVLDGIVWANGWVNIMWRTDLDPLKRGNSSVTFFESFEAFERIHVSSHPTNKTIIVWDEDEVNDLRRENEELKDKFSKKSKKLKEANEELRELKSESTDTEYDVAEGEDTYEV